MSEELFRKKSLDKIKSPENLTDYIRVSSPSMWLLFIAAAALALGAALWFFVGRPAVDAAAARAEAASGAAAVAAAELSPSDVSLSDIITE